MERDDELPVKKNKQTLVKESLSFQRWLKTSSNEHKTTYQDGVGRRRESTLLTHHLYLLRKPRSMSCNESCFIGIDIYLFGQTINIKNTEARENNMSYEFIYPYGG